MELLDLVDFSDGWAEGLADKLLEQLNRQKNPVLRRRFLAEQLKGLATQVARETADQMVGEEL